MAKASGKSAGQSAFMAPVQPDEALGAVVGNAPLPRTEITKKVWDYIKANNLQNPANKREIVADPKLQAVFGGAAKATMFEVPKHLNRHLA